MIFTDTLTNLTQLPNEGLLNLDGTGWKNAAGATGQSGASGRRPTAGAREQNKGV